MNQWKSILLTAILGAAVALPLAADDYKGPKGPCHEEVKKLCAGIEPGEGRMRECIMENKDKFSAGCKAKMQKRHEMMTKVRDACKADKEKLCPNADGKAVRSCFKENKDKLSTSCQTALKEMREKRKEYKSNKDKGGN